MREYLKFYIDGRWVDPITPKKLDVINPANEAVAGHISLGSAADVDVAVKAARKAFATWSLSTREERLALLERIIAEYKKRYDDVAKAITEEMGAPDWLAQKAQAAIGLGHLQTALGVLKHYSFEELQGSTMLVKEPIGVCGFITPWNWPINQIACKVVPALATGCTMVIKPSEVAPFSGYIWTEIMHAAGVPAGVYNMVNGDGPTVGAALSSHPEIDMVSFTGSTRAGIEVARNAAATVKRVHQELGGKSPNIILEDADLKTAVAGGVAGVMLNSGQSCNAPTRMLVPRAKMNEVMAIAKQAAEKHVVGDPSGKVQLGPVVSEVQWNKIQGLIKKGIEEGATVVAGGAGKPEGLEKGYYVKPTVFANVTNEMTIAREEIFGPVISALPFDTLEEATKRANATPYGLAAGVFTRDVSKAHRVAAALRAGSVWVNSYHVLDPAVPFGGYKMSGYGREGGAEHLDEYLNTKAVWVRLD
jgi:aldehyde dehydrogenase (NAD+)